MVVGYMRTDALVVLPHSGLSWDKDIPTVPLPKKN